MKRIFPLLVLVLAFSSIHAQNIIGGEITYSHISGFTYQMSVRISSFDSAIQQIEFYSGDGTSDTLVSSSSIGDSIYSSLFSGTHTFPGIGVYVATITSSSLSPLISNIDEPETKHFYLEDTLRILDPAFYGYNSSPVFLDGNYELGMDGQSLLYSINAYDSDGDSLSFEMVSYFPADYTFPPASDSISINSITGLISWEKPNQSGNFLIAVLTREWRLGVVMGSMLKVILIRVSDSLTGMPELDQQGYSFFPNPTSSTITLSLPSNQNAMLSIFNLLGEKVKEEKVNRSDVTIDVSELPAGLYLVRANETSIGKFVKE